MAFNTLKMNTPPFATPAISAICFLLPLCHAFSTTPEEETLKQRITALEKIVADLQTRLSKFEAPNTENTPLTAAKNNPEPWKDKANWRKLTKGMSKEEVTQLFGEPGKVATGYHFEIWYYPNPGGGSVTINDNSGVSGWSEP
jgi:hypothetical protein